MTGTGAPPSARTLLEDYVLGGKVMQLATTDGNGRPYVNNLWYAPALHPDRLYFISRPTRVHCDNVRRRPDVAGAILTIELADPSQPVQGVTFTAVARELPTTGIDAQIAVYATRWPTVAAAIDPARMAAGETHHRLYEVAVSEWILYDERHFRLAPRQRLAPAPGRT